MKLLHLDSSALGEQSASRVLTAEIVARYRAGDVGLDVMHRDLDATPVPHLTGRSLAKADPQEAALAEQLIEEFLAADVLVVGAPMYNFGIPTTLRAWIDRVLVAGRTFRYGADGVQGLAGGKQVIVVSTRGGAYGDSSPADFQEAYLRQVFGFVGIDDIRIVRAEGLAMSATDRERVLAQALASFPVPGLRRAA